MNDVDFIDAKGRPLQIGSKVNHPTHGKGRVESERADGLMVRFDGGVKFLGANEVGSLVMESRPSPVIESLLRPMSPEDAFLRKWGEPGLREVREALEVLEASKPGHRYTGGNWVPGEAVARPMNNDSGLWEVYLPGEGVWSNRHEEAMAKKIASMMNNPVSTQR